VKKGHKRAILDAIRTIDRHVTVDSSTAPVAVGGPPIAGLLDSESDDDAAATVDRKAAQAAAAAAVRACRQRTSFHAPPRLNDAVLCRLQESAFLNEKGGRRRQPPLL